MTYKVHAENLTPLKNAMITLGYATELTPLEYVQDIYFKYMLIHHPGSHPLIPSDMIASIPAGDLLTIVQQIIDEESEVRIANAFIVAPSVIRIDATGNFTFTVEPEDAVIKSVSWSCSTGSITQDGLYTPSELGLDTITLDLNNGFVVTKQLTVEPIPVVTDVTITGGTTVKSDETLQLGYTYNPVEVEVTKAEWTVDNGTITQDGLYTPSGVGTAIITLELNDTVSDIHEVTITPEDVDSVTIQGTTEPTVGSESTYTYAVQPSTAPVDTAVWSTDNGTITQGGVLTPATSGRAEVTILINGSITNTLVLNVQDKPVTGVIISGETSLAYGDNSTYTYEVTPSDAPVKTAVWSADKGSITQGGVYTANTSGTATITLTINGNVVDTHEVTVANELVTSVTITGSTTLTQNDTSTYTYTKAPTTAPVDTAVWSVDKGSITQAGVYTASDTGTATITLTVNGNVVDTHTVTVNAPALTGVTITGAETATIGTPVTLSYTKTPSNANNPSTAVWSVDIGTIDSQSGEYTPTEAGTATVTLTADGSITDTHTITVTE